MKEERKGTDRAVRSSLSGRYTIRRLPQRIGRHVLMSDVLKL